jgi:hypothetical protein
LFLESKVTAGGRDSREKVKDAKTESEMTKWNSLGQ